MFGDNNNGQLGTYIPFRHYHTPIKVNIKCKQVALGLNHTLVIDMNDKLWGFGEHINGQLGMNLINTKQSWIKEYFNIRAGSFSYGYWDYLRPKYDYRNVYYPIKIPVDFKVKCISAIKQNSFVIDFDNNVYCSGGRADLDLKYLIVKMP